MNDELIEFDDMDEDIRKKQELIAQAKEVAESETSTDGLRIANDLKRSWNRIKYWESGYEDELRDQFEGYIDAIYAKRNEIYKNAEEAKRALIAKAAELAQAEDLQKAAPMMNELMDDWKAAGSAGRATDDALYAEFKEARQVFYDRRHEAWQAQNERFDKAREIKKELIEKANELKDSKDFNRTSNAFKSLMDQWKAAGSAGRKYEDGLWKEFNAARQEFYSARSEWHEEVRKVQHENYEKKKLLIQEAQDILNSNDFSRPNTDRMKALSQDWKKAGYSGKDTDDRIWKEFRSVMDAYFDSLKKTNEQRHEDWVARMEDIKARKQELIDSQKRQIRRMEQELNGLISQGHADELNASIADKEDFIATLENEIKDIDERISE